MTYTCSQSNIVSSKTWSTITFANLPHNVRQLTPLRATSSHILLNISYIMVMISIAFSFISYTTILPTKYNFICRV